MSDLIYEKTGHVGVITLNRPQRLNAISFEMLDSLTRTLTEAEADASVRVLVLTGAGRGFAAGSISRTRPKARGSGEWGYCRRAAAQLISVRVHFQPSSSTSSTSR